MEELSAKALRREDDPAALGFATTSELEPLEGLLGQKRALAALKFGLGMREEGFNIYVAGPDGIGKMTAVEAFVSDVAAAAEPGQDLAYVNDFDDPYQPKELLLPQGTGRDLAQDMAALTDGRVD